MPFIPLNASADFPRVSAEEQAARDADAERILASEFDMDMPDENRAALEREYAQRFGKEPPATAARGFIPLAQADDGRRGFIPLDGGDAEQPSVFRNVLLNNPLTAVGEAAMNMGSQMLVLPVAGIEGLGYAAGNALGLTDKTGAEAVSHRIEAGTYQPRGELGKAAAEMVSWPFQKLAEGGQYVGGKVMDATGSPIAATAVDTAINLAPMLLDPAARAAKRIRGRGAPEGNRGIPEPTPAQEIAAAPHPESGGRGFIPLEDIDGQFQARARGVEGGDSAMHGAEYPSMEVVRSQGDKGLPGVDGELQPVPSGYGTGTDAETLARPAGSDARVLPRELRLDDGGGAAAPASVLREGEYQRSVDDSRGSSSLGRPAPENPADETGGRNQSGIQDRQNIAPLPLDQLQGRDIAAQGMVPADRGTFQRALAEDPSWNAGRAGIDTRTVQAEPRGFIPLREAIDAGAHEAATSPLNARPLPTPAQIEAGNYRKGALQLHGLDIAIENPAGSVRSGISPEGRPWQTEMQHHYGYVKRTRGKDGDPVDVFIGPKPESRRVFVIDQIDPRTGKLDEHKAVLGADSAAEAKAVYQANYEPGWKGAGAITEMSLPEFKGWIDAEKVTKPLGIPRFMGKLATEYTNAEIGKFSRSSLLSDTGRARAVAELERRAALEAMDRAASQRVSDLQNAAAPLGEADAGRSARVHASEALPGSEALAGDVQNSWAPGANYVPLVDQTRAPVIKAKSVVDLPAPLRREQIIGDLAKGLDTTIYEGRVKGEKRLGFFRPGIDEVRIKRAADIEVAAHEIAHLIDKRVPAIANTWRSDKVLREELKSISYDQKSVKEGFAEGVRLWTTQPEALQAKAPKVYAWLEDFANTHKYGPTLRKAQGQMTEWFGQDALNRARSKIGTDKPLAEYFDQFWDKFRQSTVDDLHGVYRMERGMSGGKIAPNGPYESARLSRASASIADGAVRFGYPLKQADGSFKFAGKGLEEILKPVAENMDDALLYFVGKSARELQDQGRERLFTRGEVDAMLRLRTPEREKAFQEYQAWNKGILDFAERQGIINPESRRLWQRTQYLPFHRVEQPGGLKGKPGDWAGIQALTGGTTNIRDVLGNMVGNAAMLIDKAVKNEARLKIARLSQQEGGGKFMVKIDTEARPVKVSGDQVLDAMLKKYGIAISGDAPAFFQFLIKGQPPAGKNVVAVMQHGKPVWFEVGDPILYRALTAIDRPIQSAVVRWLGMPKRVGQMTITLTPDFMLANIARDTIMGSVMSRAGFRPVLDSLKGMRLRLTKDPIYKDYIANGGGLSSVYLDEAKLRTHLEKFYGRQGIDYRTVLDTPAKLLNFVETAADAFEMSTRLGEYKRAIDKGENPRHAAYLGRDVSTDFQMAGDSKALGFLFNTVMFMRPAVVSWDRLYRGIAHDPNKMAIAAKTGIVALASMALYMLNRDDPRYADLADWDRDTNWHFFIGGQHFRYPKIWEIGSIASTAERTAEKLMAADPMGLGKDFARILGQTFSLNLMPQIIAPLAEQAMNKSSFTKAPIETPGMENLQPFLRAKPTTSETMKAAGMATRDLPENLQVNPVRAEALLRGYFNTYAMYGLMLADKAFFGDKLPEGRTDQLPVVRRFFAEDPPQHTRFETEFYDMLGEAKRLQGTLKDLDRMGRPDIADQKEKSPMAGEAKPLERAAKNLTGINHEMLAVRRDAALTPEAKRAKLNALTIERNALLKGAVLDSKAAQKAEAVRAQAILQGGRP